jgi:uncharacterized protein (DUF4415 family)
MSEERIVRRSATSAGPNKTDWKRVDALTDEDIERAIREDPDAAPLLDEDWFARARVVMPPAKEVISIRVDKDVLNFFRRIGPGYQTRMNAVLRAFVEHEVARRGAAKGSRVRTAVAVKASPAKKAPPRKTTSAAVSAKVSKSVGKLGPKKVVRR